MPEASPNERVINGGDRSAVLSCHSFSLVRDLAPDDSLQILVDHDPRPLRLQLEARHGARCAWSYLEEGPDVWRVRLRLLRAGSGDHG